MLNEKKYEGIYFYILITMNIVYQLRFDIFPKIIVIENILWRLIYYVEQLSYIHQ